MTVLDVLHKLTSGTVVTVVDRYGNILVDCESYGRLIAFKDIVNRLVYKIEIGTVNGDIIITTATM